MASSARHDDLKRPLPTVAGGALAAMCKAASDSLRLDIMRVLSNDSFGVQELAGIFAMPQPGMSHHLRVLSKSGLLVTRRQGNSIFYRRALQKGDGHLQELQASLFKTIDAMPLASQYATRIDKVYEERSAQSRLFFERNAGKFVESQGMLCELSQYLGNLRELLDLIDLPRKSRVLEVGPGQGQLLEELGRRFDRLVALDNSEEMLALTREKLGMRERVTFLHGSLESFEMAGAPDEGFDAAVLNMVLHHMSSPLQALQKLRRLVNKGRFLLIADLCSHNQEWTKASCGDVWLGFDPQDVKEWAQAAGFAEEESSYLGLKNGFQIQLQLFRAI